MGSKRTPETRETVEMRKIPGLCCAVGNSRGFGAPLGAVEPSGHLEYCRNYGLWHYRQVLVVNTA